VRKSWFWILAVAALASADPTDAVAQPPQLAGVWDLDLAASDTLELEPSDTTLTRRSRVRIGFGYPPQSRSIRDPLRMRDAVDAISPRATTLYIAQDDSTITVSFDTAPPVILYPDGRKVEGYWNAHYDVRTRTRRDDDALIVERKLPNLLEIRETWTLDPATLTVRTVVDGPIPRRLEQKLVYKRRGPTQN